MIWLGVTLFSHSVGNVIIPTDEVIFFRGVGLNHQPENANFEGIASAILIGSLELVFPIYWK